jgi:hypothetical protein
MKNLIEVKIFEVLAGTTIEDAAYEAITIAQKNKCLVEFEFNSKRIRVYDFMTQQEVCNQYYQ